MAKNDVKEIKDKLNVVDVVGQYVQLRKAGVSYVAKCPFHNEKSGSFNVSPTRQIWHCFGCGLGGDIFDFIMRVEHVEFYDALKILADKAGVILEEKPEQTGKSDKREELIRIHTFAARLFHEVLLKDKRALAARDYLAKRGLTEKEISMWQIGFAPDDFHFTGQALAAKQVSKGLMLESGLLAKNESGRVYDRFRNRITFPIFDYLGNIVGFTARILPGADAKSAKYINSPQTAIYDKSRVLFGLFFAKSEIRRADLAVVVEGQLDAISAQRAGFINTVATSGTAVTVDHIRQLIRLSKNIAFAFDSDSAGQTAMRKAGEFALEAGMNVKVVILPQGKDPDELVRTDPASFKHAVESAVWFMEFLIAKAQKAYKSGSVEQKKFVSEELLPLLAKVVDPIEREHYQTMVAEAFKISRSLLSVKPKLEKSVELEQARVEKDIDHEKLILGGMFCFPRFEEFVRINAEPELFTHMYAGSIIRDLLLGRDGDFANSKFANEAKFMVELLQQEVSLEGAERELFRTLFALQLNNLKNIQLKLSAEIKQAEEQGNSVVKNQLTAEFASNTKKRLEIEKRYFGFI
ncbi:MAG TPA: DNA primase [Patescibacteria group bacterium]|nr:DNA primase [Patescibacteria group bacterium]